MMISLILGYIGFFIAVTMERGENWVAYSHIFFLLESQLIIYAFMSFVRKVKTEKLGFVPIMLILSMSLIFINLVIQNNSFALELLLLIRVLQCAFISALGFILYKSQPIVLTGAILLGLSNFIAGVSYFYMPIPFEYTLTTVCFYLSKILLVKGYLELSKQKVTGYVT
ncbi:hypothetical protein SAMN06298216_0672 [Spirosomataceae bacterium TFI 002]|nr:hypothetical protein SAMN06298216_0672 [Spirosomataceae bacterium TFI 002]